MQDASPPSYPSRPDLLTAATNIVLPDFRVPAGWFSPAKTEGFQARLGRYHALTEKSAELLEAEYRRFLYLKALDGGDLTPSKRVDQAWHLHMDGLGDQWDSVCKALFGTTITHRTGLSPEDARAGYERTLALYRQEFGTAPPAVVWPGKNERRRKMEASFLEGFGFLGFLGFFASIAIGAIDEALKESPSQFLSFLIPILYGMGIALFFLADYVRRGTDLEQASNCG